MWSKGQEARGGGRGRSRGGRSEMAGNIGPGGGGGGGGVFAGQPIFLIQSKIQMSLYIWIYFRSIC